MTSLTRKSAPELAALIRSRAISPVEVLDAHLAVIERVNPKLNAIVTLAADHARDAAHASRGRSDARRRARPAARACRSPSRTSTPHRRHPHHVRLAAVYGSCAGGGCRGRAPSQGGRRRSYSPRPTRRNSRPAPTPSTTCSAPPAIPGTRRSVRPARPADRRSRSQPAWCRSRKAPTSAARSAFRQRSAASSASGRRRG